MNRCLKYDLIFLLIILLQPLLVFSQVTETTGNLLRIDFTKPNIDLSDTLWHWKAADYIYGESCSTVFTVDSTLYLITSYYNENPYLHGHTNTYIIREAKPKIY